MEKEFKVHEKVYISEVVREISGDENYNDSKSEIKNIYQVLSTRIFQNLVNLKRVKKSEDFLQRSPSFAISSKDLNLSEVDFKSQMSFQFGQIYKNLSVAHPESDFGDIKKLAQPKGKLRKIFEYRFHSWEIALAKNQTHFHSSKNVIDSYDPDGDVGYVVALIKELLKSSSDCKDVDLKKYFGEHNFRLINECFDDRFAASLNTIANLWKNLARDDGVDLDEFSNAMILSYRFKNLNGSVSGNLAHNPACFVRAVFNKIKDSERSSENLLTKSELSKIVCSSLAFLSKVNSSYQKSFDVQMDYLSSVPFIDGLAFNVHFKSLKKIDENWIAPLKQKLSEKNLEKFEKMYSEFVQSVQDLEKLRICKYSLGIKNDAVENFLIIEYDAKEIYSENMLKELDVNRSQTAVLSCSISKVFNENQTGEDKQVLAALSDVRSSLNQDVNKNLGGNPFIILPKNLKSNSFEDLAGIIGSKMSSLANKIQSDDVAYNLRVEGEIKAWNVDVLKSVLKTNEAVIEKVASVAPNSNGKKWSFFKL